MLASASPRRKELLELAGLTFEIMPSQVDEDLQFTPDTPESYAIRLAELKAASVFALESEALVIGADTIVVKDGVHYSKPINDEQAIQFLSELAGSTHQVITGVKVMTKETELEFASTTNVTFRPADLELIQGYVRSGDANDKAGAYGIQTLGMLFVEKIAGDYQTVVGLPVAELIHQLRHANLLTLEEGDA